MVTSRERLSESNADNHTTIAMKKRSHHKQNDRKSRSSITGERHMIARSTPVSHIPESIAEATTGCRLC